MKKVSTIIKIILAALFILASIFLVINLVKITDGRRKVAAATGEEAKYFSDDFYFNKKYYKYKDEDGTEYWIDSFTGKFSYMYDSSAEKSTKSLTLDKARQIAYDAAYLWDSAFFQSDTMWEAIEDTEYELIIFQLDEDGYRNGKFITVSVPSDKIEYIKMHTRHSKNVQVSSAISEKEAASLAYNQTESSKYPLYEADDHLVKSLFVNDGEKWVWDISIWKIKSEAIENMSESIDKDVYFSCVIDAVSGEVIESGWEE